MNKTRLAKGNYWQGRGDRWLELNVRSDRKIVEIWLTRDEKQSERVQKELKLVYQSFKGTGYTVVAFLSGEQSLEDTASDLICYNRKRIAQLEVEQEKKQDIAVTM